MGSIVECPFWDYTRNDATKRTKLNTKTLINYWGPVIKLKCFYRMFQDVAYMWHSWVWMSQSSKVCSHRISRCVEGKTVWKCAAVASASSLSSKPAQLSAPQAHNTQSSEWIIVSLIIWGESVHPEREYFHYSLYRRVDYCTETRPKKLELSDLGLTLSIKIVEWWFDETSIYHITSINSNTGALLPGICQFCEGGASEQWAQLTHTKRAIHVLCNHGLGGGARKQI